MVSVDRPLSVLKVVAAAQGPIGLADLQASLSIPKATLHRLCARLMELGFLMRDVDPKSFVAGPALRSLALDTVNNNIVRGLRHTVLSRLVADVRETCNITTLDGTQVMYLDRVEASWPLRLTLDVGAHVPIHCTASGKLFLAHLPAKTAAAICKTIELTPFTRATVRTFEELQAEFPLIRKRGYSTDREEFMAGLIAVAVPVRDSIGTVRATVAVHAPVARMSLDAAISLLPRLQSAARDISGLL